MKRNKTFLTDLNTFNNHFKKGYEHVKIKPFHLKYIFYKYKSKCFNLNLEDVLEYCNSDETLGYFCRDSSYRLLIGPDGKFFKHTHLLFFTEENIKRLINSDHILIDCTFAFPKDYYQTLIIMYYEPILEKMIK